MGQGFNFTLMSEGEPVGTVAGEFPSDEQAVLEQYLRQDSALQECRPVREGFFDGFTLTMGEPSGETKETPPPDRELLSILLHELRPFILDKEPASFSRVAGIIGRRVESQEIRALVRQLRKLYDGRASQSVFTISFDDRVVNSDSTLRDWLNAREYHRDSVKAEVVDSLFAALGEHPTVGIFLLLLGDRVAAIQSLARLTEVLLGKSKSLSFAIP